MHISREISSDEFNEEEKWVIDKNVGVKKIGAYGV